MKTIKKYTVGLFAVAVALLSGCTNETNEPMMQDGNIRITSLDINTDGVLTRAADANGYEGIVKTTWAGGDELELTVGDFTGKARYYYNGENDKGWEILNAEGNTVDEIVFTKHRMNEGISVRASYSQNGVDDAYNDVLLAEKTDGTRVGKVSFNPRNDNLAAFTLALELVHTKSYITVNLTNEITGDVVQNVQVVLRDVAGTAIIATPVSLKADDNMTFFECFANAAYIEKFVVSMLGSDNTTYKIEVYPLYGADNKGFAIETNHRYPFNITLTPSNQTRAFGNAAKGYGIITFQEK